MTKRWLIRLFVLFGIALLSYIASKNIERMIYFESNIFKIKTPTTSGKFIILWYQITMGDQLSVIWKFNFLSYFIIIFYFYCAIKPSSFNQTSYKRTEPVTTFIVFP